MNDEVRFSRNRLLHTTQLGIPAFELILNLTRKDRIEIIDVLAVSFHDYPWFRYVLQDVEGDVYDEHLRLLIGSFVDKRLRHGWPILGIRESDQLVAAVMVNEPEAPPSPEFDDPESEVACASIGSEALRRVETSEGALLAFEPELPTYFVGMIGVLPGFQGEGYGTMLMKQIEEISRRRPESSGVTLTTETSENVSFYERLGYRILGSAEVGTFTTWLLMLEH